MNKEPIRANWKTLIREHADRMAGERDRWIERNAYYYRSDVDYMRFLIPEGARVLDLGCATGHLLAALESGYGVGVDISTEMVAVARNKYPQLTFVAGDLEDDEVLGQLRGPFDYIVLSDTLGYLQDCEETFRSLHALCTRDTRLVVAYHAWFWEPILRLGELLRLKSPTPALSWLSTEDTAAMLKLADWEPVKLDWRQLLPRSLFGIGNLVNRFIATLPGVRRVCLRHYLVARSLRLAPTGQLSASVVIPCRNEKGNIEAAVTRLPRFCRDLEILYVEGGSKDETWEEIQRVIAAYPEYDIKALQQDGQGKGDAVRKAFAAARGEVLMILDADLTTPPEDMPKFYRALVNGKGEFINGTRLVYPMEQQAMRFLNFWANRMFSILFTWLLNQRYTDTLCGTKVLTKAHYQRIAVARGYFGEFDPFGDFDLIFGAAKLNLKTVEVPVRYAGREYGETQIDRFRHGLVLLRMVFFAYRKLKAV